MLSLSYIIAYMIINVYNNRAVHRQQTQQSARLRSWARELAISASDFELKLERHPAVADIRILLDLSAYKHMFNAKDTQVFNHIWREVYEYEYPLSAYHKRRLDQIVTSVEYTKRKLHEKIDHNED